MKLEPIALTAEQEGLLNVLKNSLNEFNEAYCQLVAPLSHMHPHAEINICPVHGTADSPGESVYKNIRLMLQYFSMPQGKGH